MWWYTPVTPRLGETGGWLPDHLKTKQIKRAELFLISAPPWAQTTTGIAPNSGSVSFPKSHGLEIQATVCQLWLKS